MEVGEALEADVAVIGAGPAGSTLAALLATRGVDVILLEREQFPRDKLCGEFLSYDALPILDAMGLLSRIDAAGARKIDRCRVFSNGRGYGFSLPKTARGVSRLLFDELLANHARTSGARLFTGVTVTSLAREGEGFVCHALRDGEPVEIRSRVLVGAWGRWGRFDQQLGRRFARNVTQRHFGFKRHYKRRETSESDSIDLYSYRKGYLGVSAVEGNAVNICGLVHRSRIERLKGGWESFTQSLSEDDPELRALFEAHDPVQPNFLSCEPVIFRPRRAVESSILMIGDAAGIIDPLTGNGMAMSVESALLAAPSVLAILSGAERDEEERRYVFRFRKLFASRLRWSRWIGRLLGRPSVMSPFVAIRPPAAFGRLLTARTRASAHQVSTLTREWFGHQAD